MTFQNNHDEWLAALPEPLTNDFETLDANVEAETAPHLHSTGTLVAGAAVAGAMLLNAGTARAQNSLNYQSDIPGSGDTKVLNYALALEALETALYRQALLRLTTGGTITGGGPNNTNLVIQGLGVAASEIDARYLRRFGDIEQGHRDFLDQTLGSASILRQAPFTNARFDFGINSLSRIQLNEVMLDVERTGVVAYLGAIGLISDRTTRQIAAAIQGTEARHTALFFIIVNRLSRGGLAFPNTPRNVAPVLPGTSSPGNNDIRRRAVRFCNSRRPRRNLPSPTCWWHHSGRGGRTKRAEQGLAVHQVRLRRFPSQCPGHSGDKRSFRFTNGNPFSIMLLSRRCPARWREPSASMRLKPVTGASRSWRGATFMTAARRGRQVCSDTARCRKSSHFATTPLMRWQP
jgi:hypothetical protein